MKQLIILILISFQICSAPTKRNLDEINTKDIVILHTNDVHCGVQDTIGYDGLMLYKKQLQKKYQNVITIDAGDHIQGGTMGTITNGLAIIDIMNKVQYDVVTLGNHEFDYGIPQLEECEERLNCSYISANYCFHKNKTSIYPAYKIVERNGIKIGFIGVATPQTLSKTYLISIFDSEGNPVYDFLTENKSQELYDKLQEIINNLRKEVDYVIIIGHLGIGGDALEENTSAGVLKNLEGVDAFIDGHSHLVYSTGTPDKNNKNVTLAQTGTKLANIGVLTIHENGTLSHENIDEVPYDPDLANETLNVTRSRSTKYVDKEMNQYINDIVDSFSGVLNRVIGYTPFPLTVYRNASESLESHTQLSRTGENALCNIVCDSFRAIGDANVTIMNAGTVRSDIDEGNITYQEVINTMPFSNDVFVKEITGQTILDALEFGVRSLPEPTSRFPQVSGITFKVDTSINSSVVVDEDEMFQGVNGERRVYDVKVNGEDLDVNKNYTICSHSFILNGGDGYSMFAPFPITKLSLGVDNEVFLNYIVGDLGGVIPEKYRQAGGKIVIKTKEFSIYLFGFNKLSISNSAINFNSYFISLDNYLFPQNLSFPAILTTKSLLRVLETITRTANCDLDNANSDEKKIKYSCKILGDTSGISNIKILPNNLYNDNRVNFKLSPLALKYVDNLENVPDDDSYNNIFSVLEKGDVYILDNATYNKVYLLTFNINGRIENDNDILFHGKELKLNVSRLSNETDSIDCTIYNSTEKTYYYLDCQLNHSLDYDLDGSYSLFDNNKLLYVDFGTNPSKLTFNNTRYYHKSSSKLSAGIIAVIVIVPVVVLAAVISAIIYLRKRRSINDTKVNNTPNIGDNYNSSTKI